MKKIFFVLALCLALNADKTLPDILQKDFKISLEWLKQKPKSYAKDFFIIQFLKQENTTEQEALEAYNMAHKKSSYVRKAYKKFRIIPKENLECYRASTKQLLTKNEKCIALGLTLKEATKISKNELKQFILKLNNYSKLQNHLKILASDYPLDTLMNEKNLNNFFKFFFKLGYDYRIKTFDKIFSSDFINKLAKNKSFDMFVRYTIFDKKNLQNLQKSLLNVKTNQKLFSSTLFLLGINAINHKDRDLAYYFFYHSYIKSYLRRDKDKALFWIYLITNNNSFLYELSKSWNNNIYSLYAKELLDKKTDNIIFNIKMPNIKTPFNIYDQFEWNKVLEETKKNIDDKKLEKYKNIFTDESTLPHLAFIMQRYYKYKKEYFILPYKKILEDYDLYKKTLIYSIARQESQFIPSSISISTAQGIMQIMPFLSKDIAKKLKEPYNIYEQFIPKTNIKYASYHLNSLMKQFNNNPLFIAYAYNGGAGYAKSQFKKGLFKRKDKNFEPFLSMEMISYPETREYGKRVLSNYYIYNNYLNKDNKIKLSTIFQNLVYSK